jgi:hypothetical protein
VKEKLGKFFIEVGKKEEKGLVASVSDLSVEKKPLKAKENLNKTNQNLFKIIRQKNIQAKILSKQKIP